jgi:hypothetical protein
VGGVAGSVDHATNVNASVEIGQSQWPECVRELEPNAVFYRPSDGVLQLTYGGGFGWWGLSVGPPGTKPYGGYTIPLEAGVWVWHEIQ